MNSTQSRIVAAAVLYLLLFLSGFWLSRTGKPYPVGIFTIHKLIALGVLALLSISVYRAQQSAPLDALQLAAAVILLAALLVTIVTGGLVSAMQAAPPVAARAHQLAPYLGLLAAVVLLLARSTELLRI